MGNDEYTNELDQARYKYNKLIKTNILQTALNIILASIIFYQITHPVIILKSPYNNYKDETIKDGVIDHENLNQFAIQITTLTQNLTYKNAEKSLIHILPLIESQNFEKVKKDLQKEARYIQRNKIVQVFYTSNIDVSKPGVIEVRGVRYRTFFGSKLTDAPDEITLTIHYITKYGTYFRITDMGIKKK